MSKIRVLDKLWKSLKLYSIFEGLLLVFFFSSIGTPAQPISNLHSGFTNSYKPRVLVLHSYHHGFTWSDSISKGIRSVFEERKYKAELLFEFMDTRRIASEEYFQELKSLYEVKYRERPIDVIICSDDHALNFMLNLGEKVFPNVPVVFCSVSGYNPSMRKGRQLTGLIESIDIKATLDIALKLHPGIKEVAVITDMTRTGRALKAKADKVFLPYQHRLRFKYLEELVVEDLRQQVSLLSNETIIFLFIFSRDKAGHVFSHEENLENLVKYSKVPIYAVWDFYLGHGIVGGKLTSGIAEGKMVCKMALRILDGEKASDISPSHSPVQYMFDYNQMKRFNVKESMLPENSIIINKPFSFYKKYKLVVWTTILIFLILVTTIITLNLNILKRKRAEEALRESEERYRTVLETSLDPIVVYGMEGKVAYFNPAFTRIFGWSLEERLGKKMDLFVPDDAWPETQKMIEKVLAGENFSGFETQRYTKSGNIVHVNMSAAIYKDQNGNPIGSVINLRDITEQKKLEAQLQQAQKMESIGTLAGGIAHDFNNILGIIIGNTELALDDISEQDRVYFNLEEILTAGQRAKDVVKQLLSFARKTELKQKPIKLIPVVKDSIKFLRSMIPTNVDIRQNIIATDETIIADPTQIHQVMINLCTNASHAMQETGGILGIEIENVFFKEQSDTPHPDLLPGSYVKLTVSDTGQGIHPEHKDKIFDPYFTTKEVGRGTGLGLSVVHGIVKNYGGLISVESEVKKGTTFYIYFPVIEEKAVIDTKTIEELPKGNEKILFVDDDKSIIYVVRYRLERLGYKVETKTNPIEALELFRSAPDNFDLIITDMAMPQMTGDHLVEEILKIRPDTPTILCTGFSEKIDEKKAKEIGATEYIEKPIDKRDFAIKIRSVLDEKKCKV